MCVFVCVCVCMCVYVWVCMCVCMCYVHLSYSHTHILTITYSHITHPPHPPQSHTPKSHRYGHIHRGIGHISPAPGAGPGCTAAAGRCHMPICPYVIVIELHKRHVIVFLSIFPYDIWMDQIWTFNLVYIYGIRYVSFCSTYNVFSFYGLSYILYLYTYDIYTYTSQGGEKTTCITIIDTIILTICTNNAYTYDTHLSGGAGGAAELARFGS
jgi:hypothetical protein